MASEEVVQAEGLQAQEDGVGGRVGAEDANIGEAATDSPAGEQQADMLNADADADIVADAGNGTPEQTGDGAAIEERNNEDIMQPQDGVLQSGQQQSEHETQEGQGEHPDDTVPTQQLAVVPENQVLTKSATLPQEPPYIPPEVGEDYVPVAELPPLPLPYDVDEEGRPVVLPGVQSLFLTGTTLEIVGLTGLSNDKSAGAKSMAFVARDDLLKDIQFRGAISDFHAFKQRIIEADYDFICFQINQDDIYGDGNNFLMAGKKEVADRWQYIEEETVRRQQLLRDEQIRAAIEKAKPHSKKIRNVKPWVSMGSEVEIEEAAVRPKREAISMMLSRVRREFNQPFRHTDRDAHELWNSSQMECRPFKDPNFDLKRMQQDVGVQAVPAVSDVCLQAGARTVRPQAVQYSAIQLPQGGSADALAELARSRFLDRAVHQCEVALIQNEITNIFADDFSNLADEEGLASSRKESIITETQSFTHLNYSKNKVVTAIQWLPHRRGVIAVACTEALSYAERVARAGRPSFAYILIWNFKDSIHPECVLQAPVEVHAFQYNPCNPDIIAAGCYNGQVVVWDTSSELDSRGARRQGGGGGGEGSGGTAAGDDPSIPIIKCRYVTTIDMSHQSVVADLKWLPGIEISSRGRVSRAAEGTRECNFFATTAGDGKVNFWDVRVDRVTRRGRKADDATELVWKPVHSLHLISLIGMDLAGAKLSFRVSDMEQGLFSVGSADGELVVADFIKPEGEENPDYVRSITQAHLGPVVSLEASPFLPDITLTVGDWSFQIWRDGQTNPLFTSGYATDCYTCGCWSPSRPAVLYLADQSGNIEVWDLLDRSHEPSIRTTVASTAIMSMAFMDTAAATLASSAAAVVGGAGIGGVGGGGGPQQALAAAQPQYLALGDSAGVLRIVELPRNLRRPVTNEKKLMLEFLKREADRVTDVTARKPIRDAANKAFEEAQKRAQEEAEQATKDLGNKDQNNAQHTSKSALSTSHASIAKSSMLQSQQQMVSLVDEKAEAAYYKMEHRFKIQLGLIPAES